MPDAEDQILADPGAEEQAKIVGGGDEAGRLGGKPGDIEPETEQRRHQTVAELEDQRGKNDGQNGTIDGHGSPMGRREAT